ncbi:hypothetical protein K438DRAFT_246184 [Mycena galopus ATCC 62051]|nr:hypothetical protein K438DRAFT_246184 [Mycena galopus ATCC 62051]
MALFIGISWVMLGCHLHAQICLEICRMPLNLSLFSAAGISGILLFPSNEQPFSTLTNAALNNNIRSMNQISPARPQCHYHYHSNCSSAPDRM